MREKHQTMDKNDDIPEKSEDLEDKWMIRDCDFYKSEYKECTSIRGRFHQYFIFGETSDCRQWKKDHDNCCRYLDGDRPAGERLVESERARYEARLRAHYGNTVWRKRSAPPAAWASPLPQWISERDSSSYLAERARELRGEVAPAPPDTGLCVLM